MLPFETEIALIKVPGYVLQEAIAETRSTPHLEASNFLHADFDVVIEDYPSLKIVSINHAPFDPQKIYTLGIYQFLLTGLNEIKPLLDYVNANDGFISPAELHSALTERTGRNQKGLIGLMFEVLDANKDGKVSMDELASLAM